MNALSPRSESRVSRARHAAQQHPAMVDGDFRDGQPLLRRGARVDPTGQRSDSADARCIMSTRTRHFRATCPGRLPELEQALALVQGRTDLDSYLDILQSLAFFASMAGQHGAVKRATRKIIQLTEPRGESCTGRTH